MATQQMHVQSGLRLACCARASAAIAWQGSHAKKVPEGVVLPLDDERSGVENLRVILDSYSAAGGDQEGPSQIAWQSDGSVVCNGAPAGANSLLHAAIVWQSPNVKIVGLILRVRTWGRRR
jgi:hypothetical protein